MPKKEITKLKLFYMMPIVSIICLLIIIFSDKRLSKLNLKIYPEQQALPEHQFNYESFKESFLVDTPYCKIPNVDPFDSTILKFYKYQDPVMCKGNQSLVYSEGLYLFINWTAVNTTPYAQTLKYCTLTPIYRPKNESRDHSYVTYLKEISAFNTTVKVEHEFVRVNCYNNRSKIIFVDFHAFVIPVENGLNKVNGSTDSRRPSVLLIGIDSLSRLSFIRHMRKSRSFIENKLNAYNMMGYNKVADNTFPNIVPLTLGKYISETSWNQNQTLDDLNFIWKQYSKNGYRTLMAEDAPRAATFDYDKKGFALSPTDHYYRPFSLAMTQEENQWTSKLCFRDRFETEIVLNYTLDFVKVYNKMPVFAFTYLTAVTHDDENGASKMDETFYKFFSSASKSDNFQNTFIFFYSDHGIRFGNIRNTVVGKYEERLPFMYLILPEWFRKKFVNVSNTVKTNQRRLSTPFDVYETLQDILHLKDPIKRLLYSRGISWLNEIPVNRTCESAGILPHWCTCLQHEKLNNDNAVAIEASHKVLSYINALLDNYHQLCESLSIKLLHSAERLYQSDLVLAGAKAVNISINKAKIEKARAKTFDDLQIKIETVPGNALFEATVRVKMSGSKKYQLLGDISRTNKYGDQSYCIRDTYLQKFCYCKGLSSQ